jgi:hypothetical protein
MTEINYTHILLDAIYEHSKFASKFILRECLKANEKHIDNEEFYSSLLDAVMFFEKKINDLYSRNLNRYYLGVNEDKVLPKNNKSHFPKPELESIGIPLLVYYSKYSGHIYIEDLIKIKSVIHGLYLNKEKTKIKKISAPIIAFFCQIINHSGIIKQGEYSNEAYCKKVILEFKLNANPGTVRKYYNQNIDLIKLKNKIVEIEKLILPTLSDTTRDKVKKFITNQTKMFT